MGFVLLILGIAIGGAIAWYLMQQRVGDLERQHKQYLDRQKQTLEQDFEVQKQTARKNHDRELQTLQAELKTLKAQLAAPQPIAAPAPQPASAPAPSASTPRPAAQLPDPWGGVSAAAAPTPEPAPTPAPEPVAEPEPEAIAVAEPEVIAKPEPEVVAESEPQPEPEVISEPEPEVVAESKPQPEPEVIAEPEPEVVAEPEPIAPPVDPVVSGPTQPSPIEQVARLANQVRTIGHRAEGQKPIADLLKLAANADPAVRAAAIEALGTVNRADVITLLEKSRYDASPIVVRVAAKALDRLKNHRAIEPTEAPQPLPPNGGPVQN